MRPLCAVRRRQHLRPYPTEQQPDLQRRLQMRQQRRRIRTVPATPVRRRRSRRRRIRHQRLVPQQVLVQVREAAAADAAERRRPLHRARQRVVPARVQDHQPQRRARRRDQQVVDRHRLEAHVDIALQTCVHRDEVVDAVHLDAVAGVEHQRHVCRGAPPRERAQRLGQLHAIGVELVRHLEPKSPQRRRDVAGIVVRVRQPADVRVGAVAHHQRHAAIGQHDRGDREDDERHRTVHDERPQNSHCAQLPTALS